MRVGAGPSAQSAEDLLKVAGKVVILYLLDLQISACVALAVSESVSTTKVRD